MAMPAKTASKKEQASNEQRARGKRAANKERARSKQKAADYRPLFEENSKIRAFWRRLFADGV